MVEVWYTHHFDDVGGIGSDGSCRVLTGWKTQFSFSPTSCEDVSPQQPCWADITQVEESKPSSAHRRSQLPGLPASVSQHLPDRKLLGQLPLGRSPTTSTCCSARSGHLEDTSTEDEWLEETAAPPATRKGWTKTVLVFSFPFGAWLPLHPEYN